MLTRLRRPMWSLTKKENPSFFNLLSLLHLQSTSEIWNDNFCELKLLTKWDNFRLDPTIQKKQLMEVGTTITMHEVKIGKWMDKAGDSRPHPKTFKHHEVHTNQIGWTNANQRHSRRLRKSLKAVIPKWTHDCLRRHNRNQSTYKWPNPVAQSLYSSPSQNSLSCCLLLQSNIIASE